MLLALQLVIHLVLDGSLQRVCEELGEAVEEQCQVVRPVQHQSLGSRVHLSQDVKYTLQVRRLAKMGGRERGRGGEGGRGGGGEGCLGIRMQWNLR